MARRVMACVAMLLLVAGLLAACSTSTETAANALEVGDCTDQDLLGAVGEVDTVECSEPHSFEVVGVYDIEGDEFPGSSELQAEANEGCASEFADYVGGPPEAAQGEFGLSFLVPTEDSWEQGDDRTIICIVSAADGSDLEGSVEGSAR